MPKNARIFELREGYLQLLSWLRRLHGLVKKLKASGRESPVDPLASEAQTLWLERLKRQISPPQ